MSCDVALAAYLFLASTGPAGAAPVIAPAAAPARSVAAEPLFVDIVGRASRLKAQVDGYLGRGDFKTAPAALPLPQFDHFQADVAALSALDMQAHLELAKRGEDGDLKCILRGISADLPIKLKELTEAPTGPAQGAALRDMAYLLNDNVEVITAPPAPPV